MLPSWSLHVLVYITKGEGISILHLPLPTLTGPAWLMLQAEKSNGKWPFDGVGAQLFWLLYIRTYKMLLLPFYCCDVIFTTTNVLWIIHQKLGERFFMLFRVLCWCAQHGGKMLREWDSNDFDFHLEVPFASTTILSHRFLFHSQYQTAVCQPWRLQKCH